jgi:hypothetical protein
LKSIKIVARVRVEFDISYEQVAHNCFFSKKIPGALLLFSATAERRVSSEEGGRKKLTA